MRVRGSIGALKISALDAIKGLDRLRHRSFLFPMRSGVRRRLRFHQGGDMGGDGAGEPVEIIAALEQRDDAALRNCFRASSISRRVAQAKSASTRLRPPSGSRRCASKPAEMIEEVGREGFERGRIAVPIASRNASPPSPARSGALTI